MMGKRYYMRDKRVLQNVMVQVSVLATLTRRLRDRISRC